MEGRRSLVTAEGGAGLPNSETVFPGWARHSADTAQQPSAPKGTGSSSGSSTSEPTPGRTSSLVPYLRLTRELAGVLMPIKPRTEFREQLRNSLVASVRRQQAQRILFRAGPAASPRPVRHGRDGLKDSANAQPAAYSPSLSEQPGIMGPLEVGLPRQIAVAAYAQFERSGHRWVWGAAALGSAAVSLSLVGVVAYVVRHRNREAA